jgi:hypothetical protein
MVSQVSKARPGAPGGITRAVEEMFIMDEFPRKRTSGANAFSVQVFAVEI